MAKPVRADSLKPGMKHPTVQVIQAVTMTAEGTTLTFEDGSTLQLGTNDAIEVDDG